VSRFSSQKSHPTNCLDMQPNGGHHRLFFPISRGWRLTQVLSPLSDWAGSVTASDTSLHTVHGLHNAGYKTRRPTAVFTSKRREYKLLF